MNCSTVVRVILSFFLATVPAAHAQVDETPTMAFDCWVTTDDPLATTHYIVCIPDRDDLPPVDDAIDPPEIIALDRVHELLHSGTLGDLDRYAWDNMELLKNAGLRRIRIFSYPSTWSWDEESPHLLVQMLCPDGYVCPVYIRR
jgi:hypothetical protein